MERKENDCSPETDDLIREFCRENDVGKMRGCPKCGIKGKDIPLTAFCQHAYCPIREWRAAKRDRHGARTGTP